MGGEQQGLTGDARVEAGILGVGVDVVAISRFTAKLEGTPALLQRLFTEAERELALASLAARFAAKEALIKALGGDHDLRWSALEVRRERGSRPRFTLTRELQHVLAKLGAAEPLLSLSHDGDTAIAFVVLPRAAASSAH